MRERSPDWQRRWRDVCARYRATPHAYGKADCATFWADAVYAVSGVDTLAPYRRRHRTKRGAVRVMRTNGFTSTEQMADALFTRVSADELHRGDLAFAPSFMDAHTAPAVMDAGHAVAFGASGLVTIPRHLIAHGWAV